MRSNRVAVSSLTAAILLWPGLQAAADTGPVQRAGAAAGDIQSADFLQAGIQPASGWRDDALAGPPEPAAAAEQARQLAGLGTPIDGERLEQIRGGAELVINDMHLAGVVADNTANRVITGSNAITEGAFANASGLPTVIQNTGANTLIQNATILNVQFRP